MPRAKQRTPELAQRVLEAALTLAQREGLDALTARGLARAAGTSPAAVYELFGDKQGVVRAMFFDGFRQLGAALDAVPREDDAYRELLAIAQGYRRFLLERPALSALMFSRPFAAFDPAPEELAAGAGVRERITSTVERAIAAGRLDGEVADIAHAYVALIQGLAAAESARRLGRTVERRWDVAVRALLAGFSAPGTHR